MGWVRKDRPTLPAVGAGLTLSYKRLAGVQQDLAALYDHALYRQILPDVLSLAHFIVHDSSKMDGNQRPFAPFRLNSM